MKKILVALLAVAIVAGMFFSCSKKDDQGEASLKVGMITDAGTIDDKSFNQGTWEGIQRAKKDTGIESKYLKPVGTTEADYMKEITNLYDAGYKFIVTPGYKFESTIFQAQDKYADAKFVLIDGTPHSADYSEFRAESNVVSIFFAEQESAFLAAVATALQLKDGEVGFIGGMEIPPVQRFNWGFQQGIAYANENLGTNIVMKAENFLYQGSFTEVAAGQQIGAQMYDKGIKAIFCAAGKVGVGTINEAKTRTKSGEEVWVVGVDVDQYADGLYDGNNSVVITSAMKRIDQAAYDMIQAQLNDKFPGGETLTLNAQNNGVGIPEENPNLSADVQSKVADVLAKIKSGAIVVSAEQGDLFK